jgi:TonB family protein
VHVGLRVTHIDKAALAEITALGKTLATRAGDKERTPAEQLASFKPLLRSYAKAAMAPGAALDIDDISARYHGEKMALKGRVTLEGGTPADLDTPGALLKKIVARFEIRVPIALVREIAGKVVAQQTAQQGKPADPDTLARLRQSATDVIVGKLTGGGFARVENEVLVSNLEWRAGALRANGKPVALGMPPGMLGAAGPQAAAAPGTSALPMLQARRIETSCTLPDYPAEVVRLDQPLRFGAQVIVGADGKVKRVVAGKPSAYPDYDRAVLAALAQCSYIPALRGGTAIPAAMPFQIERAPGAKHP